MQRNVILLPLAFKENSFRLLAEASAFAVAKNMVLRVLHVCNNSGETGWAHSKLRALLEAVKAPNAEQLVLCGRPRDVIVSSACKPDVGMVFLNSASDYHVLGRAIGGDCEFVAKRVKCPVLTLKHLEREMAILED